MRRFDRLAGAPTVPTLVLAALLLPPADTAARGPISNEFDRTPEGASRHELPALDRTLLPCAAAPGPGRPGEDLLHALVIPALPFVATGSTCEFRDDHAPECTFLGGAPDVVYAYRAEGSECVTVQLCGSDYDTALQIYDGMLERPAGCDDDGCAPGSRLDHFALEAGHTYYFVIDGWDAGCGNYVFDLRPCPPPCPVPHPVGAILEPEPVCSDGYYDRTNTGCNDWPYTFTDLACEAGEIVVRGTYGTWRYGGEEFRDTDWYRIPIHRAGRIDWTVLGEAETQVAILDGRLGCPEWGIACGSVFGARCETIACEAEVEPGEYWLFVAPRRFVGVPCGTPYLFTLRGAACPTVQLEASSWTRVKAHYR